MTYVLIMVYTVGILSSGGVTSSVAEFKDFVSCNSAATEMAANLSNKYGNSVGIVYHCAPTETPKWAKK